MSNRLFFFGHADTESIAPPLLPRSPRRGKYTESRANGETWRSGGGEQRLGERDETVDIRGPLSCAACTNPFTRRRTVTRSLLPGYPKGVDARRLVDFSLKWYVPRRQEEYDTVYRAFRRRHRGTHTNERGCVSDSRQLPPIRKSATSVVCECVDRCMLVLEGTWL